MLTILHKYVIILRLVGKAEALHIEYIGAKTMVKIVPISDIHWEGRAIMPEQADKHLVSGDILILAGDIINARYLKNKPDCHFDTFLKLANERFKHVVAIAGNHESYHCVFEEMHDFMKKYYEDNNVHYLNCETVELCGLNIFGGTLWTDFNNSKEARDVAQDMMNDFRFIKKAREPNKFGIKERAFYPLDALEEWIKFMRTFREKATAKNIDVVISHHAPSLKSISERFKKAGLINYAYTSDLEYTIKQWNPKLWIHGHMHEDFDYMIENTRVVCNPWGYRHENRELKLNKVIEI